MGKKLSKVTKEELAVNRVNIRGMCGPTTWLSRLSSEGYEVVSTVMLDALLHAAGTSRKEEEINVR